MKQIECGALAPRFSLLDQDNNAQMPTNFLGKWLVVYFYPKASTPGCTTQACGIRDIYTQLASLGVEVIGISPDLPTKLKKFATTQGLPFRLLSDPDHQVAEAFGVWQLKKFMGKSFMGVVRRTFIIDPKGIIASILVDFKTSTHHETLTTKLQQLLAEYKD
jgi:thioredoxin-dependent peroxiredoxin